jgi:predicted branched-subunit amino acid permease
VAVGVFGIAFGVLAVQAGLAAWLTVVASVVIVSGAAQFALVGLLAAGPGPVLVATTGLALRHLPMSAKLASLVGDHSLRTRVGLDSAWVSGTAVGAFVGKAIDPAALGIDVLFALLFLGLAAPLIRTRRDWLVVGVAVVCAALATLVLPEAWKITGAATVAAFIGTAIRE